MKYSEGVNICYGKRYMQGRYLKMLDRGDVDMIRSELVRVSVSRLNIIISSELADEPVSRLDTMIRLGLTSSSVSRLDAVTNAVIR